MTASSRLVVFAGTRPEAIKIAPLVLGLRQQLGGRVALVDTGQHPGRVGEALAAFELESDVELHIARRTGSLSELAALLLARSDEILTGDRADAVVVQGDTLSAFAGGLVAFWHRIPVVHLEAGLRTHDLARPFPEEAHRAMLARITTLHLAPTPRARQHLMAEGIEPDGIVVTGNTVVDALHHLLRHGIARTPSFVDGSGPVVVATAHRRESWGDGIAAVCTALRGLAGLYPLAQIVMVVHPNPAVAAAVRSQLADVRGLRITEPLPYPEMVGLLDRASLVITDSGGLQEEAATLGVPLLVTRDTTERPEALLDGGGELVGTDPDRIVDAAVARLTADRRRRTAAPFGDGHAAGRCVSAIADLLGVPLTPTAADLVTTA